MSNTVILLKKSVVSGNTPGSLRDGEIAINTADGILFYKNPSNIIKYIRNTNSFETVNVNGTLLLSTSPNDILSFSGNNGIQLYGNSSTDTIQISVTNASLSTKGVVQLYDGTNSSSNTLAATANVVNSVYQLANAAYDLAYSYVGGARLTTNYKVEQYTATAGQTNFVVNDGYIVDYISVYVNGVLLNTSDYTATDSINVTITVPLSQGDAVSIAKWFFDSTQYLSAIQKYEQTTANSGQYLFRSNTTYTPGFIKVYRNGILLEDSEIVATDGANVSLVHAATANDIITLHYWGATAIGTTPVYQTANQALLLGQQSYNAANASLILAQQASLDANTALTAYDTANSALVLAQQASNNANTALTAYNTANSALILAQQASDNANTALTVYNTANAALVLAQQASDNANTALTAYNTANSALILAQQASDNANTALTAYTTANTALLNANTALSLVQQASDNANNALLLANNSMQQLSYANLFSSSVTTSANTANQVLDIFSTTQYRSVKYLIQVSSGTDYQSSEVILVHNGTESFVSEYGLVTTSHQSIMDYDTDISGGNVRLLMSPLNNINTIKFVKTSIVL